MIDIENFDQNNIEINHSKNIKNAKIYSIKYNNDLIKMKLNNVKVPFGIEKYYNDYIIKIQLSDSTIKNIINNVEKEIINVEPNILFKSQIKKSENYEDLLIVKILSNNEMKIESADTSLTTIFNISKNAIIDIVIFIDIIWISDTIKVAKFKTKDIKIINI